MNYVVFEAGSRAGLSAMLFFLQYREKENTNDVLIMVDSDETFVKSFKDMYPGVIAMSENVWYDYVMLLDPDDVTVFPADELTRQRCVPIANKWWNSVRPEYYDKRYVNEKLASVGINVPKTFHVSKNVIVKPNSLSAGSKGISIFDNVCVSEMISIAHEYVIDCFHQPGVKCELHARETKLKNGYDKYVRMIPHTDKVYDFAKQVMLDSPIKGMFQGPFHLQVAEDESGTLYYIEGSKRISGTSLVNLLYGYNPFLSLAGKEMRLEASYPYDEWFSFEHMLGQVWRSIL